MVDHNDKVGMTKEVGSENRQRGREAETASPFAFVKVDGGPFGKSLPVQGV